MKPDDLEPMSPSMKALLDAERPLDVVPAATRAKLFAKVSASVAGAAAVGGAGAGTAALGGKAAGASAAAGTATATVTTKIIIAAAVAFSVGGGVGASVHAVVAPPRQLQPPPIIIRMEAPPAPRPQPEQAPPVEEPSPPPPLKPQPKRSDDLGTERSLIEQARAALSRHDAPAALTALKQHEREYPAGQLTEERLALQAIALAETGDAAKAREVATRFRAKYPQSLLMPAVDNASPP